MPLDASLHHELLIAGFGGQGVLTLGQMLAAAAVLEGREVVWAPAYGPEMRGGPSFCSVILSSAPIGSPVIAQVDSALIMDRPSLPKYHGMVRPDGLLILNSSLVAPELAPRDRRSYAVRANHIAEELGEIRIANMIMLGALLELTHLVQPASILASLRASLPERRRHLLPLNEQALASGAAAVTAITASV